MHSFLEVPGSSVGRDLGRGFKSHPGTYPFLARETAGAPAHVAKNDGRMCVNTTSCGNAGEPVGGEPPSLKRLYKHFGQNMAYP